jgi:hypothetical protein
MPELKISFESLTMNIKNRTNQRAQIFVLLTALHKTSLGTNFKIQNK